MAVLFLWELGLTLFIIYIITLIIGSIFLFNKARINTKSLGKFDTYGFCISIFFILLTIGYIFRVYFMFFLAHNEEEIGKYHNRSSHLTSHLWARTQSLPLHQVRL